jgi:hypothetical protein
MKHPPSKTIGRKFWLAKVCNQQHISKGEYGFSPANFNPTKMSLAEAREAGKAKTLWPPHGRLFGAQIWRMAHEANVGDVIFLESENRHVHAWGTIVSEYQFKALNKSSNDELHSLGVKWHKITDGKNAFRIGKGDNLLFREITKRDNLLPILKKFIDAPLKSVPQQPDKNAPQDIEYLEGGKVLRSHLSTERDAKIVKLAKDLARKNSKSGMIACETCGAIPEKDYRGLDLIEAHHRRPLAEGVRKTKPGDFAMLCPCCHRAVHKLINDDVNPLNALKSVFKLFAQ